MTAVTNGPVCGNCGKRVAPDAVTCSHCGVLLAAYQSTAGSETLSIVTPESPVEGSTTQETAASSPTTPPVTTPTTPPFTPPAGTSPIGDALRRSHDEVQADLRHETMSSSLASDELAAMAAGEDDLAVMADRDDDLASMASGNDELAAMAGAGRDGSFEDAVNAELAGARVVFAGDTPVIEAAEVEVVAPGEGEPDVVDQAAVPPATGTTPSAGSATASDPPPGTSSTASATPSSAASPSSPPATRSQRPSPAERGRAQASPPVEVVNPASGRQRTQPADANPSRVPSAPSWQSLPGGSQPIWPQDKPKPDLSKMVGPLMAIPFLLIVCLIVGAGRDVGTFMFVSFVTMIIIVSLLVRAAQMATRKTTSMPRDDSRNWQ